MIFKDEEEEDDIESVRSYDPPQPTQRREQV
jgi:hypothetical protein